MQMQNALAARVEAVPLPGAADAEMCRGNFGPALDSALPQTRKQSSIAQHRQS